MSFLELQYVLHNLLNAVAGMLVPCRRQAAGCAALLSQATLAADVNAGAVQTSQAGRCLQEQLLMKAKSSALSAETCATQSAID